MTKKELEELMDQKEQELVKLRKKAKIAEMYEQFDEAAGTIRAVHDSFVNQGYTDKQAFELTKTVLQSVAPTLNIRR